MNGSAREKWRRDVQAANEQRRLKYDQARVAEAVLHEKIADANDDNLPARQIAEIIEMSRSRVNQIMQRRNRG